MNYDVIIIGAGPGGIFAAYELMKEMPDCKVAVFEEGYSLEKRKCPIDGKKIKNCINCKRCSIMCGFGGAGAFSDGKYNITNDFGGTLYEHIGKSQAIELMKYVDDINMEYGGQGTKLYSTAGTKFKKLCLQNKLNLLDASVRHLGTDINYVVLENLYNAMKDNIDFYFDAPRISAKTGLNVEEVLEQIVTKIPAPQGDVNAPLKALIFDSIYDAYKGVIVFCRVMDGRVKKGTQIRMMATGFTTEVVEVGYFGAGQFIPCDELTAGMVGYITASIKNLGDTRVGDTVTDNERPCAEALPGYKKVQPMVYCGLYPADGARYGDLRDALEKLQLNDASLFFEPETSIALGFGFRCGFLGLLHLEIIQERLEREYNLDLVTTAPGVVYKVYKTNGEVIELTNPSNLPDPSEIEYMEEPMVNAEIMVTTEFIGAIMDLCQERRGQYNGMEYMEETRALLKYKLPLNEIIYDFFDALKSRSRGYASLDYELCGYERSELVKLDILVNKEEVDALSFSFSHILRPRS